MHAVSPEVLTTLLTLVVTNIIGTQAVKRGLEWVVSKLAGAVTELPGWVKAIVLPLVGAIALAASGHGNVVDLIGGTGAAGLLDDSTVIALLSSAAFSIFRKKDTA